MSNYSDDEERILSAFDHMDAIEKLIFLSCLRAFAAKALTVEQFEARTSDLFRRHRAGQELTVADLESIRP